MEVTGTQRARRVLAPNPSPMTLTGTNTWVIAEPGAGEAVVVDPGPSDHGHLERILGKAAAAGQRVTRILLTHSHPDHADGVAALSARTGAPVFPCHDGDVLGVGGCEVRVIATPGHSADSVCLHLPADHALLTGDTILGRGTTVIAEDGSLAGYLASLRRLRTLATDAGLTVLLPGHGPVVTDPAGTIDAYLEHRQQRLTEIRAALAAGDRTPAEVVARVYADVDISLRQFAEWSVRAQLEYLRGQGDLPPGVSN